MKRRTRLLAACLASLMVVTSAAPTTWAAESSPLAEGSETEEDTTDGKNTETEDEQNTEITTDYAITVTDKPADGTTSGQPFASGTAGSTYFRIPALITTKDGTLVAAADARWETAADALGIDTMVSRSTDQGGTWKYTFANYLGDYGNGTASPATSKKYAATFIDPELLYDADEGENGTIYMLVDLYVGCYAINTVPNKPVSGSAFTADGYLKLKKKGETDYNYYLKDGQIYQAAQNSEESSEEETKTAVDTVVADYTVDGKFNLLQGTKIVSNLFFNAESEEQIPEYQAYPTTYLYLTKSTDNGATWSDPQLLNVKNDDEIFYGVGPGRGLKTSDGTLMFSCYSYDSSKPQKASFIYSTDRGATWKRTSDATSDAWSSESQLVELSNGTIRMFYRNGNNYICYVDALKGTDSEGNVTYTWETPVKTEVVNWSNCQISAMMYSTKIDGKDAILVSCPTASNRYSGRIFVGLVNDDQTMDWKYTYKGMGSGKYQYSCMTELSDNSIGILYENGDASIAYQKLSIEDIAGEEAVISDFWVADAQGAVVKQVIMKPSETASYTVVGMNSEQVTVTSSDTSVVTVALDDTAAVSAEGTVSFTVTPNRNAAAGRTATITVTDGENSYEFEVIVTDSETKNHEIVQLSVGDSVTYTDETGYYVNVDSGIDQKVASVSMTGEERATYQMAQLKDGTEFIAEYIDLSDCLYTFTKSGDTDGVYTVSGTTSDGVTVYLDCAQTNNIPNYSTSQSSTVAVTAAGDTNNSFKLKANGKYLHFRKGNDGLYFDRCGSDSTSCGTKHYYELYQKSDALDGVLKGFTQITSLNDITDGGQYLIVSRDTDGSFYLLRPYSGTPYSQHVAKVADDASVTRMVQVGSSISNNKAVFAGDSKKLEDCQYTFTSTGTNDQYYLSAVNEDGVTVYFNIESNDYSGGQRPHQATSSAVTLKTGATTGTFKLYAEKSGNNASGAYVHFRTTGNNQLIFDRCGDDSCGANHEFEIYHSSAKAVSAISGYEQITSLSDIKDGEAYLIVFKVSNNERYVLNPPAGTSDFQSAASYTHVAKLGGYVQIPKAVTEITFTGVRGGDTVAVIGDTTYYIQVESEEKELELAVGDKIEIAGSAEEADLGEILSIAEESTYVQVEKPENGGSYVIGNADTVLTTTTVTTSKGNWGNGFVLSGSVNYETNADTYRNYEWMITFAGTVDEATEIYPCYISTEVDGVRKYMSFADSKYNNTGNSHVTLETTPQKLQLSGTSGSYSISRQETNVSYLTDLGNARERAAGWQGASTAWNFYERDTVTTLTGLTPGTVDVTIDHVIYHITVKEAVTKEIRLAVGETTDIYGQIPEEALAYLSVREKGQYELTTQLEDGEAYVIGQSNIVLTTTEQTPSNGWTAGFKLESGADYVHNADTYAGYEWMLEILEGADESTKTYPCYLSTVKDGTKKYFAFITTTTANNTKIYLSDTAQELRVKQDDNGTYSISIQSDSKTSYLNNFGGANWHASGYAVYGAGWNFYKRDITSAVTGYKVGTTAFGIGNVSYTITVVDQVDYTRLEKLVLAVSGLETDKTFTEESRAGLVTALTAAEQMIANKDLTEYSEQEALDAAQKKVNDAAKTIVKAVMHLRVEAGSWPVMLGTNVIGSDALAGSGLEVTKMTVCEGLTLDLEASEGTVWSVSSEEWLSADENGSVVIKEDIAGDDALAAYITAETDGNTYKIPVIICPDVEDGVVFCNHIDEISNSDIYYAWMGEEDLIPASEGELFYVKAESAQKLGLSFFGAPTDGYTMTRMSATEDPEKYYMVGADGALNETETGYLSRVDEEDAETVRTLLTSAMEKGCIGAMGYVKEADSEETVNAGLTFRAEKLPTMETTVAGIIPTDDHDQLKKSGLRTFVDGMSASKGEYVYLRIRVTTYRPYDEVTRTRAAEADGLGITGLILENTGLPDGSFVEQMGDTIPKTSVTTKDVTDVIAQDDWSEGAESIDHDFYYVYQVKASSEDTVIENSASMTMDYTGGSVASFTETAAAETTLDVDQFPEKDIVIDFGLPVTVHYDPWNKTVNGTESSVVLNPEEGSALYGAVTVSGDKLEGWDITYTPDKTLLGIDIVRFYDMDGAEYLFKVYPANSVYYEAAFFEVAEAETEKWSCGTAVTDVQECASAEDTQKSEDAASNYGYDPAYVTDPETAALSEEAVKAGELVANEAKTTASFTFTGTGVDLYANCAEDTGTAMVMIKQMVDGAAQVKKIIFVDTQLLLGETDKGLKLDQYDEITNVPIVSLKEGSLEYGTYVVTLTHTQKKQVITDEEGNKTSEDVATTLRLDGFRVYGTSPDDEIRHVYKADEEYAPAYEVLRDQVLSSLDTKTEAIQADTAEAAAEEVAERTSEENETAVGALVVSNKGYNEEQLSDLLKNGSKNELYLYPGQTVTFKLNTPKIQIAMRALGDPVSVTGTKELTVNAQVDMYYCMSGQASDEGYVYTITNGASAEAAAPSVLSITKIKTVAAEETEEMVQFLSMAGADLIPAMKALGYTVVDGSENPKEDPPTGETPVIRLGGANRYETSRKIADSYKKLRKLESFDTLIVADGRNFPDALSGGYLAVKKEAPILLVKEAQETEVLAYIQENLKADGTVYILGGEAAVSKTFQQSLEASGTYTVKRLGGSDRYETNIFILEEGGITDEPILICTGQDFADGITASASGAPILLAGKKGFTQAQQQFLAEHGENECQIIGGSNAVPEYVETGLKAEGRTVTRLGGTNRYETAAAIADAFYTDPEAIVIAYGSEFADGLCGGPLAALMNAPLLLASEGHETQAAAYAEAHQIERGTVLGGESRISDALLTQIFSK